jgi:hypothetical protein
MWKRFQFAPVSFVAPWIVAVVAPAAYTQSACADAAQRPESKLAFMSSDARLVPNKI